MSRSSPFLRPLAVVWLMLLAMAAEAAPLHVSLPAQPLADSIRQLADIAGITIAVDGALVAGKSAPAVDGNLEPAAALAQLLAGRGLVANAAGGNIVITQQASGITLDPLRVQGAQYEKGPNGSTDVTATEGTGSYTTDEMTVGSKIALSVRDTPQSVSVITQQRIQDQNLNDLYSVLNEMPGISLITGSSLSSTIVSRGFQINSYQVDGGGSIGIANLPGNGRPIPLTPLFDMGEYDHVEVIRGSDGMWTGIGDPSGSINLVRKRPLDHDQVNVEVDGGSWNQYRGMVDATAPLALDGKLRGRFVFTGQTQDYFYDVADRRQFLTYGTLEYDVTPSTLATLGGSVTNVDAIINGDGLPRYSTGADLHLPRDTCLCFFWNTTHVNNQEYFGKLEQHFGPDWTLGLNATENRNYTLPHAGNISGTINPVTLTGAATSGTFFSQGTSKQTALEALLKGNFELLGHKQQVVVGYNETYFSFDFQQDYQGCCYYEFPTTWKNTPVNVFNYNPYDFLQAPPIGNLAALGNDPSRVASGITGSKQGAVYYALFLTPLDRLHVTGGGRFLYYSYPSSSTARLEQPSHMVPYGAVTFDLTRTLSVYGSYTDILQPQVTYLAGPPPGNNNPLPPLTGGETEFGLKGQYFEKKLNASLAVYRIDERNEPEGDELYNGTNSYAYLNLSNDAACCYVPDGVLRSEGVDAEVAGQVLPGLQVSGSYNYNLTEQTQQPSKAAGYTLSGPAYGQPNFTQAPKHLFKLWANWQLAGQGVLPETWWKRFSVGLGVDGETSTYVGGSVCPSPLDFDPMGNCTVSQIPFRFQQNTYAVVNGRVGYRIDKHWTTQLNIGNLLDKTYYVTPGSSSSNNWYGDPRNFMLTVRASLF